MYDRGVRSSSETNTHSASHRPIASVSNSGLLTSGGTMTTAATPPTKVPMTRNSAFDSTAPASGCATIYAVRNAQ